MVSVDVSVVAVIAAATLVVVIIVIGVWKHKRKSKGIADFISEYVTLCDSTTTVVSVKSSEMDQQVYKQWQVSLLWFIFSKFNFHSHSLGRHPSTTAEVSQADYESTQASSESTGTQIPVTGSSTRSDSGTWPA